MSDRGSLSTEGQQYLERLRKLTDHVDPLAITDSALLIRDAAASIQQLPSIGIDTLTTWVSERPQDVYTLALAVGLSQEKLKNLLKGEFNTQSWAKAGRESPRDVVEWLDREFGLVEALMAQVGRTYTLGDVLAARGTSRQTASRAGAAGRLIKNQVEAIVQDLRLPYRMRGRFVGRNGETGPADLAIPDFDSAVITVACKGFDSTGSKLTAAVTEVQEMAQVRFAHQYVFGVVDGIGWRSRQGDFRRMFALLEAGRIDGLYTLADLARFAGDLRDAGVRAKLLDP
jgi:hypothetical protein